MSVMTSGVVFMVCQMFI